MTSLPFTFRPGGRRRSPQATPRRRPFPLRYLRWETARAILNVVLDVLCLVLFVGGLVTGVILTGGWLIGRVAALFA